MTVPDESVRAVFQTLKWGKDGVRKLVSTTCETSGIFWKRLISIDFSEYSDSLAAYECAQFLDEGEIFEHYTDTVDEFSEHSRMLWPLKATCTFEYDKDHGTKVEKIPFADCVTYSKAIHSNDGYESGFCYLALILPEFHDVVKRALSSEPPLYQVFSLPFEFFHDRSVLERVTFSFVDKRGLVLHVNTSRHGYKFCYVVRSVMRTHLPVKGSMLDFLFPIYENLVFPRPSVTIDGSTLIGGDAALKQFLINEFMYVGLSPEYIQRTFDFEEAVLSRTAGLLDVEQKKRQRVLEALGDAYLSYFVALCVLGNKKSAQEYQESRGKYTTNSHLTQIFNSVFNKDHFSAPFGVSFASGNVGAKMFETVVGYLSYGCSHNTMFLLFSRWKLFDQEMFVSARPPAIGF